MVIFHSYVSLPEGNIQPTKHKTVGVPAMCNGHQCGVRKCVASAIAAIEMPKSRLHRTTAILIVIIYIYVYIIIYNQSTVLFQIVMISMIVIVIIYIYII